MNQSQLLHALQQVAPVANDKGTMPVLGCVLFKDGQVMATDTLQRVTVPLDAPLDNVAVPAKKLLTIVKSAPKDKELVLDHKQGSLSIGFGRSRYTIPTIDGNDFPTPPPVESIAEFDILDTVLNEAVVSIIRQTAKEDVRYFLNGAKLEVIDGAMTLVGTNGHKLGAWSGPVSADDCECILSRNCLDHLARIKPNGDDVRVKITPTESVFVFPDREYGARMIDGKFPEWRRVVPSDGTPVTFDRDHMLDACKRANALFQDVLFKFSGTACEIMAESKDGERAIDEIDAQGGEGVKVAFNAQYMVEALETLDGAITMQVKDESSACKLTDEEGGLIHVCMPVRM